MGDKGMFVSKRERGVLREDILSSLENRNLKAFGGLLKGRFRYELESDVAQPFPAG